MLRFTGGWGPYGLPLARCPTRPGEGIDDSAVTPSHQAGPPFPILILMFVSDGEKLKYLQSKL